MYVCKYVCMYVRLNMSTNMCMYVFVCVCMFVSLYVGCLNVFMYVCIKSQFSSRFQKRRDLVNLKLVVKIKNAVRSNESVPRCT